MQSTGLNNLTLALHYLFDVQMWTIGFEVEYSFQFIWHYIFRLNCSVLIHIIYTLEVISNALVVFRPAIQPLSCTSSVPLNTEAHLVACFSSVLRCFLSLLFMIVLSAACHPHSAFSDPMLSQRTPTHQLDRQHSFDVILVNWQWEHSRKYRHEFIIALLSYFYSWYVAGVLEEDVLLDQLEPYISII